MEVVDVHGGANTGKDNKHHVVNIDLPDGWVKRVVRRTNGATGLSGRYDVYITPPDGKKIRSSNELMKFIIENPSVPVDPRYVNMETVFELPTNFDNLTSTTKKLIEFVSSVKSGEVDPKSFIKDKPSNSAHAREPKPKLLKLNTLIPAVPDTVQKAPVKLSELMARTKSRARPSHHQARMKSKFSPQSSGRYSMPNFSMAQAIKLEHLLLSHPDVPNPDQISHWSNELGIPYVHLQQWIRIKWYIKHKAAYGNNIDVETVMNDTDPFDPSVYCDVLLQD